MDAYQPSFLPRRSQVPPPVVQGSGPIGGLGVFDLGMVRVGFDVVFSGGKCKLPNAFCGIKRILIVAGVIAFLNPENINNCIVRANFNCNFLGMVNFDTEIDTSPKFSLMEV